MRKSFYIDYPQEHVEGQAHVYRCAYCKVITTTINGRLEGHLPSCEYRKRLENTGFEVEEASNNSACSTCDEVD